MKRTGFTVFLAMILAPVQTPQAAAADEDSIKLTFLGTGAPRPSHVRYGPSILLEAGDHQFLIDAGPGLRERLFQAGGFELLTDIDHVLLTHLHFDHTIGLPGVWLTGWLFGRKTPMTVYGPAGTSRMMKRFQAAYDWDIRYREIVGVHEEGSDLIAHDVEAGVIFEKDGLKITAFEVEHMPINVETEELLGLEGSTFGYRIDYRGRSVLFSGDTRSTPSSNIIKHGKGVDVLIHEVQVPAPGDSPEARLANVSLSVHSTPAQVAYIFEKTRPRMGVYSHIIPPELTSEQILGATDYEGPMMVAEDLMTLTIGDEITVGRAEGVGTDIFTQADVVDKLADDLQPGTNRIELEHDGRLREMLVRLPDDYSPEKKYPVIFGFHGSGGPMEAYHRQLEGVVDTHGMISVSPQGISNSEGKTGWNGFANHRISNTDDVGFVVKTVEHLAKHASIDRQRIYATGGSSGAIFCFRLAMETDLFAAIAPMRGAMINRPPVPENRPQLSILLVGGTDDPLFYGGPSAHPAEVFYTAHETMSLWAANHGVESPEPTPEASPPNVTLTRFSPPESSYELLLYAVKDSGHKIEKTELENAIRFMGEFFSKHTKRGSLNASTPATPKQSK